ncbi:MAG: hypothetical protein CMJ18_23680 [Phycisphaeraceae bacterium]|nr:hypothetical protein [Phycisphaeraceae bacterium]
MIDTHCHLTYDGLFEQVDDVMQRAEAAGLTRMITVGTTPDDARKALALAQRRETVWATAGVHPHYCDEIPDAAAAMEAIEAMAAEPCVVALGEMGMDRHYPDPPIERQRSMLERQLELASRVELPVIIHNREATDDVLEVLVGCGVPGDRFVFHCFTGSRQELDRILAFGAMVSFTGIVTFRSASDLAEGAASVPLERLMVETDSPFLTPEPYRKVRPNEPRFVTNVARFLAEQRGMDTQDFVEAVDANALRFFWGRGAGGRGGD